MATGIDGGGDLVVFLHAGVCDRRMWDRQLADVGATNKAVAYDRRGFGETRAEYENFSAVADLMAVIHAVAGDEPATLVGCSQGGQIAIDMALHHPSSVRGLVLIAPSVSGAPIAVYPPDVEHVMAALKEAEKAGDLEQANTIKAHLWLDGPLQSGGRVSGQTRELFLDMNGIALRTPPTGMNLDVAPAFDRLGEITVPSLVISGNLDFPHIQERSRHIGATLPNGTWHELTGVAHLPSLECPADVSSLISEFIDR